MNYKSYTLGVPPFNLDIAYPFPAAQRQILENAIANVSITHASQIANLDEELHKQLSPHGFVWEGNDPHRKCKIWRPDSRATIDFYHERDRIGIEVEKTEVKRIPHDFLKLMNGSLCFVPKIRFGVLVFPDVYRTAGRDNAFSTRVFKEIPFFFRRLLPSTLLNDVLFLVYSI